jgi:hypothetical protein
VFVCGARFFSYAGLVQVLGACLELGGNTDLVPLRARDLNLEFAGLNEVGRQDELTDVRTRVIEAGA